MSFKSVPENEAKVKWCQERLKQMLPESVITKHELIEHSGCPELFTKKRHILNRARARLRREDGILFVAVTGVGLKRCTDTMCVEEGDRMILMSRRSARRSVQSIACVRSFESLPQKARQRALTVQSVAGLIEATTKNSTMTQMELRMSDRQKELPWKESIEWLKGTS